MCLLLILLEIVRLEIIFNDDVADNPNLLMAVALPVRLENMKMRSLSEQRCNKRIRGFTEKQKDYLGLRSLSP